MEEDEEINVHTSKRKKVKLVILLLILILITVACSVPFVTLFKEDNCAVWGLSAQEIESFNSKFISNVGYNKQGSVARHLCSIVITNNYQWLGDDESRIVYIKMGDITGLDTREKWKNSDAIYEPMELSNIRNSIASWKRYDITASYDEKGMIMGIGIIEKPSSNTVQNIMNTNNM